MSIGVLASGEGTILQSVLDACMQGRLDASVGVVISNNSGSVALRRAAASSIPTRHLSSKTHSDPATLDGTMRSCLGQAKVDVVLLAGFMKKLGPETLDAYAGRVLNTHPALLPKFGGAGMYGDHVHRAVLAAGESTSGASVHLVVAEYDAGPVVAQRVIDVRPNDTVETLGERVRASERILVVDVLRDLARGALRLPIDPGREASANGAASTRV
jgi:phosphoribosylglycinamide formyltransferase-1